MNSVNFSSAKQLLFGGLVAAGFAAQVHAAPRLQDDVADVPAEDRLAGDDANMRYFLIGAEEGRKAPKDGNRLLLVMPGGDGSAEFLAFVKRIYKNALSEDYLVAQLVAPKWDEKQFDSNVWPTKGYGWPKAKFVTEEFLDAVITDVEESHELDPNYIFTLAWSSSGQAAYSYSLTKDSRVTGTFVAMSVFKPEQLPNLKAAKGKAYYILHSPQDFIPIAMAEEARDQLTKKKAEVGFATYEGGHGWRGNVYGNIKDGVSFLERKHGEPVKTKKKKMKKAGKR